MGIATRAHVVLSNLILGTHTQIVALVNTSSIYGYVIDGRDTHDIRDTIRSSMAWTPMEEAAHNSLRLRTPTLSS